MAPRVPSRRGNGIRPRFRTIGTPCAGEFPPLASASLGKWRIAVKKRIKLAEFSRAETFAAFLFPIPPHLPPLIHTYTYLLSLRISRAIPFAALLFSKDSRLRANLFYLFSIHRGSRSTLSIAALSVRSPLLFLSRCRSHGSSFFSVPRTFAKRRPPQVIRLPPPVFLSYPLADS